MKLFIAEKPSLGKAIAHPTAPENRKRKARNVQFAVSLRLF